MTELLLQNWKKTNYQRDYDKPAEIEIRVDIKNKEV